MTDATLRQALAYARRGWPVFPCLPGQKIPATTHGFRDATTDEQQITAWFTRHPDRNLAIATGAPGPDVLDVDQHGPDGNGFPAFARLRRAGLLDRRQPPTSAPPAAACTPTSPAPASATATCPPTTWTSAPPAATSWPRPPTSTATPTSSSRPPAPTAASTGTPSPSCCNPSGSSNAPSPARPPTRPSATWPAGSPASPKATATRACSGPPTAPWRPTRPPT